MRWRRRVFERRIVLVRGGGEHKKCWVVGFAVGASSEGASQLCRQPFFQFVLLGQVVLERWRQPGRMS